jgi:hypothetical protein
MAGQPAIEINTLMAGQPAVKVESSMDSCGHQVLSLQENLLQLPPVDMQLL